MSTFELEEFLVPSLLDQLKPYYAQFAAYFPELAHKIPAFGKEPQPSVAVIMELYNLDIPITTFLGNLNKIQVLKAEASKLERQLQRPRGGKSWFVHILCPQRPLLQVLILLFRGPRFH